MFAFVMLLSLSLSAGSINAVPVDKISGGGEMARSIDGRPTTVPAIGWREAPSEFRHFNSGFRPEPMAHNRELRIDRRAQRPHTHSASLPPRRNGCETCRLTIWR
ncbi:hypothetical protein [Sphingomonas paeninsulae]|nr:hypothetical protein [Sphingomonas paeninsulae]